MKAKLTAKEEELMMLFWEYGQMCIRDLVNCLPERKYLRFILNALYLYIIMYI